MRTIALALLLGALARADEVQEVDWADGWDAAFENAKETRRPVMVCINSKDGEGANEFAAGHIYRDLRFVVASRRFVMVVVSTVDHASKGPCPRFGKVTCQEHLDCWKGLNAAFGAAFAVEGRVGEMISPQHAWFSADGKLLRRKEYALGRQELLKMMKAVLAETGEKAAPRERGTLTDADRAELRKLDAPEKETRAAAVGKLLSTGKPVVHDALLALLGGPARAEIVGALAAAEAEGARAAAEKLLADRDPAVRSAAAVALEDLGERESIPALLRRARAEEDEAVRKEVFRALGVCGGASGDKGALKLLLDAAASDPRKALRKHAALALKGYEGPHAAVARKRVEQAATAEKDPDVRRAFAYVLAYVGDAKSVPVLERILGAEDSEKGAAFVRGAIARLKAPAGGDDRFKDSAKWLLADDPAR